MGRPTWLANSVGLRKGERPRVGTPCGHWKTTTFVAGLGIIGVVAPMVIDRPIDRISFQAHAEPEGA